MGPPDEQNVFDDAKTHYTLAHEIRESYDTWFGLGNIDRHEGQLSDALLKYKQARLFASDTAEIDNEIKSISFALNVT